MQNTANQLIKFVTQSIYFGESTQKSEAMDSQIWDKYLKLASKIYAKRGDYIIEIGDNPQGLFFIKRGKVKANLLNKDGVIKTLYIREERTIFGEQFIFHHQPGISEVIALADSELYFFDREQIFKIMKNDFDIVLFINRCQALTSRMMVYQVQDLSGRNILQSLARIIYSIYCYEKIKGAKDVPLAVSITHEELANMLGAHRVTVTKNINYIKKLGIINYKYEKIMILDPEKLKQ